MSLLLGVNFQSFTIDYGVSRGFFIDAVYRLRKFFSIPNLLSVFFFIHEGRCILSNSFLYMWLRLRGIGPYSITMVYYIIKFSDIKTTVQLEVRD